MINRLKKDLKGYENILKGSLGSISEMAAELPPNESEIFSNLQQEIQEGIRTGKTSKVLEAREKLMNLLKERHAPSDPGHQP